MEKVAEFIARYAKAFWEINIENNFGKWTDREFQKAADKITKDFIGYPGGFDLPRTSAKTRKEKQTRREDYSLEENAPVPLMIVEYKKGKNALWRAFVSTDRSPDSYLGFGSIYDVVNDGTLKIVAESLLCAECGGLGEIKGRKCPECKGKRYLTIQGKAPADYGTIVDVLKLQKPETPKHIAFYDKFEAGK